MYYFTYFVKQYEEKREREIMFIIFYVILYL